MREEGTRSRLSESGTPELQRRTASTTWISIDGPSESRPVSDADEFLGRDRRNWKKLEAQDASSGTEPRGDYPLAAGEQHCSYPSSKKVGNEHALIGQVTNAMMTKGDHNRMDK